MTRDGRNARIICTDQKGTLYKVIGLVDNGDEEKICNFTKKGESHFGVKTNIDLFFNTEKHEGWVNVYKGEKGDYFTLGSMIYDRKEDAEGCRVEDCVATVKIEWEE